MVYKNDKYVYNVLQYEIRECLLTREYESKNWGPHLTV